MESFLMAKPVWIAGKENEVNCRVEFKTAISGYSRCQIAVATSGMYQLWVNGHFVAYGPARAGKDHFRVDHLEIGDFLREKENIILVDVAGYRTNSYAIQNQPSFLQAEITCQDQVIAATGRNFSARQHPYYMRRMQRYSFQRPMVESYCITRLDDPFYRDPGYRGEAKLSCVGEKKLIRRWAAYPQYETMDAVAIKRGAVTQAQTPELWRHRSLTDIGPNLVGFPMDQLEEILTDTYGKMAFSPADVPVSPELKAGEYRTYRLDREASGFLTLRVDCREKTTLYILFDEICSGDGLVNPLRFGCCNVIRYTLCPGTHELQLFEVYAMQYIQLVAVEGECRVSHVGMTEYKHPPVEITKCPDPRLQEIQEAAVETFRQNAVDIFMDCPSRERAGWLCDSLFTARTEYRLTGKSPVETGFLENFLHEEAYDNLPDGMLPMCYPADFGDGNYIPQWAMWLVLQLREYSQRCPDSDLCSRFEQRVQRLMALLEKYENQDGLLEKLDGWCFVEWSKANDFVQDVHYPTNMLYSAALDAAGKLYGREDWIRKAQHVKAEVLKQSYDGTFFVDNALRQEGKLKLTGERSEVCQYFAFFLGIATAQSHPQLLRTLAEDFGPQRKDPDPWREIYPAAPFIGFYMRLDILLRNGYRDIALENIRGYFTHMAQTTGTLWENADTRASCNHGFASYVFCLLDDLFQ